MHLQYVQCKDMFEKAINIYIYIHTYIWLHLQTYYFSFFVSAIPEFSVVDPRIAHFQWSFFFPGMLHGDAKSVHSPCFKAFKILLCFFHLFRIMGMNPVCGALTSQSSCLMLSRVLQQRAAIPKNVQVK